MSVFDLRQWLADADRVGELEHVRGADAVLEIGTASQLNYRRKRPRALLFDEITGYQPGQRVLTSSLSSPALMGLTLGLGAGLDDRGLVDAMRGRPSAWAGRLPAGGRGQRRPAAPRRAAVAGAGPVSGGPNQEDAP